MARRLSSERNCSKIQRHWDRPVRRTKHLTRGDFHMPVRVGVIGVGVMGAEHVRLLSTVVSGSEVAAIFDVDATRAAGIAEQYGARSFDDPMVLIKDEQIEGMLMPSSDQNQ